MAEVGQRLGTGAYRLSSLINSRSRPVSTGESPGARPVTCSLCDCRLKDESTREQREVQPTNGAALRSSETLPSGGSKRENATSLCVTSLRQDSSRLTRERPQAHTAALFVSARLEPLLQEPLLPGRMTPWTRGAVSIHRDAFRCHQQPRAFCTVVFIVSEQRSQSLRRVKVHPDALHNSTRGYSRKSDGSSKHSPLLYRSRTSYYDTLKVSPAATQSQIKTAYYKQSFIYHPDKNPGDEEASQHFSKISEAYSVLSNIGLRKKYDRGILSRSDVHSPSSRETVSRPAGSPQQQQHRARRFSKAGGKTMFDFDAFYQAHYGEQLQRERDMKARKQRMEEQQKEKLNKWREGMKMEVTVAMLLTLAGVLLFGLSKP